MQRLVTEEDFLMTTQDPFLMLGHGTDVEIASTLPLQQQRRAPQHDATEQTQGSFTIATQQRRQDAET